MRPKTSARFTPPYADKVRLCDYSGTNAPNFAVGAELGRFNMGSTVIVLVPPGVHLHEHLQAEQAVQVGQSLGRVSTSAG